MKAVPESKYAQVKYHLENGLSIRKVADICCVSKSLVHEIRSKIDRPLVNNPDGPRTKLSPQLQRYCIRLMTAGSIKTTTQMAQTINTEFGIGVSRMTVSRTLKNSGLKSAEKLSKPMLSQKNIRARLEFANMYKEWTVEDWKHVIWSDETKINRFGSDGRSWYWSRDNETIQPHHVKATVKHGGGSIMIWGCMTAQGVGFMCQIIGKMNKELYQDILEDELAKTIEYYDLNPEKVIFQQDNCPIHKAKSVDQYIKKQQYSLLQWPAQSPDLNPIEHLWAKVKRELNKYDTPSKGLNELWERVECIWNEKISENDCLVLIESMPRRIQAVLKAGGYWTKY
jgi:transposase